MRRSVLAHVLALVSVAGILSPFGAGAHEVEWGLPIVVFNAVTVTVGWLIVRRRPEIALGWLLLVISVLFGLQGIAALAGAGLHDSSPQIAQWLLWYGGDNEWSWFLPLGLLVTQVPLRFPDGLLPSPRWRWFSRATVAALVIASVVGMTEGRSVGSGLANPTYVDFGAATAAIDFVGVAVLVPAFVGSVASLVVRYRGAGIVPRTQLRWVFWAVAVAVGVLLIGGIVELIVGDAAGLAGQIALALQYATGFGYALIPLAILFAVLRYGLFSIDRIISRTASYAIVTLITVAVYGSIVVLVSVLVPDSTSGPVAVALATLAAAAVFLPLLRVVRAWVDRRFNRAQYDAEKVVDAFGERVRNGADPHGAGTDLVGAVTQTLQPSMIGLWTREDAR